MTRRSGLPDALIALFVLLAATLVAYFPALSAGFVWDDVTLLQAHVLREGFEGLLKIWTNPAAMPGEEHYWPVVYTAFWVQVRLWGGISDATGFHLTNILLHAVNAWLLGILLLRLKVVPRGAWAAALLFSLHPAHVESVAWVIELKDVLSACLYLGAALMFLNFHDASRRRPGWLVLSLMLFVLGMLTKTIVATLPVGIALALWWRNGNLRRTDVLALSPMLALALLLGLLDIAVASGSGTADFELPLLIRLQIAGHAVWFYLAKLFLPIGLVPIYPRWSFESGSIVALLPAAGVVGLLIILWTARYRIGRAPFAAFAFYLLTLAPLLGFIRFSFMEHSFVADRFQYLASAGPIALLGGAWGVVEGRIAYGPLTLWRTAMGTLLICLAVLTWRQAAFWKSSQTLFERTIRLNPSAWLAHQILGGVYATNGEWNRAAVTFRRALDLKPGDNMNRRNLAYVLARAGEREEAVRLLHEALERDPSDAKAAGMLRQITVEDALTSGSAR